MCSGAAQAPVTTPVTDESVWAKAEDPLSLPDGGWMTSPAVVVA